MLKKIAAAAALAFVASTAAAADVPGFYMGADFGQTKINAIVDDGVEYFGDRETSYGIFAGYQINQSFAIEGNFRRLASFEERFSGIPVDFDFNQIGLSVVGTLPLSNNFSVFGRLGYNRLDIKASAGGFSEDDDESGALYGIGVGYDFTPTVSARLEFQKPSSDSTNVSAGVVFKF